MSSKNTRDQKPAPSGGKPAKAGSEVRDRDLDKVTGGMSASGLPSGKRGHLPLTVSGDPCEGGQ